MSPRAPLTQVDASLPVSANEPPIVARVVVEVRSDGTRTIARGALEVEDEKVSLGAEGNSPAELANALTRVVVKMLLERAELGLLKWAPTLLGDARIERLRAGASRPRNEPHMPASPPASKRESGRASARAARAGTRTGS